MTAERFFELRKKMVEFQITARGVSDPRLLSVMEEVPRHKFVPQNVRKNAYDDCPLPIGFGQTISQPYIVAVMTELLELTPTDRVLEIGTGSGYQAAILGKLAQEVISLERIPEVADMAESNLRECGITNVKVIVYDGTRGYPDKAPYDAVIVTAAAPEIPETHTDQLLDGGRLVAPVGDKWVQTLVKLEKKAGKIEGKACGSVRFVPLIGEFGWES